MSLLEFWELTPYEFSIRADGYYRKARIEEEDKLTAAYMTAMWAAQWLTTCKFKEKPKDLNEILGRTEQKEMTDEDLFKQVKALNAAIGGEVT